MGDGLEQAMELMRRARYSEAIERLRHGLSHDPDNAPMRALCGEAYYRAGNHERAFHHYNKAAASYLRSGETAASLKMLHLASSMSPNEPDILFRMAECMKSLGDRTHELEGTLRQLIQVARATGDRRRLWAIEELGARYPDDLELATLRADAMIETGNVANGAAAWRRLAPHFDHLGIDFMAKATAMTSLAPDDVSVGVEVAATMLFLSRPREAIVLLAPYYEKFPEHLGILELLPEALEAIGVRDKVVAARTELIKARTRAGQRELGLQEIARLLEVAPDDVDVLEVSAYAYAAFEEEPAAIALWRRLSGIYERLGKRAERDRSVLKVITLDPDDEEALEIGARSLRESGRAAEAQEFENRLGALRRRRNPSPPRPPPPVAAKKIEVLARQATPAQAPPRSPSDATMFLGEADFEKIQDILEDEIPTGNFEALSEEPLIPPRLIEARAERAAVPTHGDLVDGLVLEASTRPEVLPLADASARDDGDDDGTYGDDDGLSVTYRSASEAPIVARPNVLIPMPARGLRDPAADSPIEEIEEVTSRETSPVSEEFLDAKAAAPTVVAVNPPSASWSRLAEKARLQTLPAELAHRALPQPKPQSETRSERTEKPADTMPGGPTPSKRGG